AGHILRSFTRCIHPGLKYEDLFFDDDPAVKEAIRRLTPEQKLARERRLFRAMDISLKRVPLPEHIQKAHDPFEVKRFIKGF
ncbi:unnamed protein product, partial [Sphacelaria rigidula]